MVATFAQACDIFGVAINIHDMDLADVTIML
jgi:hypothetical protein